MRVRRFLHLLLLLLAGVLAWLTVMTWRRPLPVMEAAAPSGGEKDDPLPSAQMLTPEMGKQFAEAIADKDLFSPSRSRAPKEQSAPLVAVPPPSHLKLVGVVLSAEREEAFFADASQGGKVVRARKGESVGSYYLALVTPLRAVLTLGKDGAEVNLDLLVVDSGTAARGPHLIPAVAHPAAVRMQPGQVLPGGVVPTRGGGPGVPPVPSPQNETQAIRQNIQQLQQRLRQVRRQAAREAASNPEEGEGEKEEEEE